MHTITLCPAGGYNILFCIVTLFEASLRHHLFPNGFFLAHTFWKTRINNSNTFALPAAITKHAFCLCGRALLRCSP